MTMPSLETLRLGSHVVELQFALGLVLFLEVSGQLVEDGPTAPALHVAPRRPVDRVDLKTGFFI